MAIRCVVLDFDGTFTDVEAEAGPFLDAFRRDVADLLGRDISGDWARLERKVIEEPQHHGWEYGGRIVAPANADPYVRATCISQLLFTEAGILKDAETRSTVLQAVYQKSYRLTCTAFRPDAAEVLGKIRATGLPVFVITNAHTGTVLQKLQALGFREDGQLKVLGEARKFIICDDSDGDPRFAQLPGEQRLEGLATRPVWLKRGRYFDALKQAWAESGAGPTETLVCGDIYELDLALPAALGCQVHLVCRPGVPAHELAALAAMEGRGGHSDALAGVLPRLR